MTDLERLKACFDALEITYQVAVHKTYTVVTLAGKVGNVGGYDSASCDFSFSNTTGSKMSVDCWGV